MQPAGLRWDANLIAAGDRRLRRHASHRDAVIANPGLEQDLGAELFDDVDPGIEAQARRAVAEREVFGTHSHDRLPTVVGFERTRVSGGDRQFEAWGLDRC